jgi:hypothetical protein
MSKTKSLGNHIWSPKNMYMLALQIDMNEARAIGWGIRQLLKHA